MNPYPRFLTTSVVTAFRLEDGSVLLVAAGTRWATVNYAPQRQSLPASDMIAQQEAHVEELKIVTNQLIALHGGSPVK